MTGQFNQLCEALGERLRVAYARLLTVESCTGGGIASSLTNIAGSSDWFDRALVTYSNLAKTEMAGVSANLIEVYGAVSPEIAEEMAVGALRQTESLISDGPCYAISVTGIAGPGGGSEEKPVGTVCFGWARREVASAGGSIQLMSTDRQYFTGDRQAVRHATIEHALARLLILLEQN